MISKEKFDESAKIIIGGIATANEIDSFYNTLEKEEQKFDDYVIAYIDFLGIKEKIKQSSSYESMRILKFLALGMKKTGSYISDINKIEDFKIKIFSDNIVIAQKIHKEKLCNQIISMVNLVASIQFHALFQFDFWLRGGVTIGELFIDDTVVWGPGLVEAYNIESKVANYPRVIVSKDVLFAYNNCERKSLNLYAFIKEDIDGLWYIDYYIAAPNIRLIPQIAEILAEKAKDFLDKDDKTKQKYNWVITGFNTMCYKLTDRGDYEKYVLPYV